MARNSMTLADLRTKSMALAEFFRQQASLPRLSHGDRQASSVTGNDAGPAAYDLHAIWRAALADEGHEQTIGRRRYMSPVHYCKSWDFMVSSREDIGTGRNRRILVDRRAALDYVQQLDQRVMRAAIEASEVHENEEIARDPIGHVINASRGGPFALMFVWTKARVAAGMDSAAFGNAVLSRAKAMASTMDPIAAETLFDHVQKAIQDRPTGVICQVGEDGVARIVD